VFAVPVGMLLKSSSSADDSQVVARFGDELQSNGKILIGKAAGHRERGQSAKISDAAERIRKD